MYIKLIYDIIRFSVNDNIAFKFTYSDIEKHALGKLIAKYEKLTNREDLVKELKDLVRQRNIIAHQAYLLSTEQMTDITYLDDQSDKLRMLSERTQKANAEINKELTQATDIFERITINLKGQPGQSGSEKSSEIEQP